MRWSAPNGDFVSDDRSLIDVDRVHRWLSTETYWAADRPLEVVRRSIDRSLTLGLYDDTGSQLGLCRWITDASTFAWLADVFVDPAARGGGRGTFLVASAVAHPDVADLRLLLLGTRDAHGLYAKFGFTSDFAPNQYMERRR